MVNFAAGHWLTPHDRHSSTLPVSALSKLFDSITSGLSAAVDSTQKSIDSDDQDSFTTHRKILEAYAFLLNWFVTRAAEKGGKAEEDAPPPPSKSKVQSSFTLFLC